MKLYELSDNYMKLLDMAEEGQIDAEVVNDTLESIESEIETKALNIGKLIRNLEANNLVLDDEIKRLQARKKSQTNTIANVKSYLQSTMEYIGKDNIETNLFKFKLQSNPPRLEIHKEDFIPEEFLIYEKKIKRQDLLKYVKEHDVQGVEIVQGKGLRIK